MATLIFFGGVNCAAAENGPFPLARRRRRQRQPALVVVKKFCTTSVVNILIGFSQEGPSFSHGIALEIYLMGVVHETVRDGISDCRFADDPEPFINGQLTGNESGS